MASICKNCIYGGTMLGFKGQAQLFSEAILKKDGKTVSINYNENEYGCRNAAFRSKEEVCLNNKFSEFRTLQDYLVTCPPQIMVMKDDESQN